MQVKWAFKSVSVLSLLVLFDWDFHTILLE